MEEIINSEGKRLRFYGRKAKKIALKRVRIAKQRNAKVDASKNFLESREWQELRYRALKLHGARCQCCGATRKDGKEIHVDHIKPRSRFPLLALDIANLQVLCGDCNRGKGAWDETDWR
jgi:5-methylcytosine-specific restriction endonuclease McrA